MITNLISAAKGRAGGRLAAIAIAAAVLVPAATASAGTTYGNTLRMVFRSVPAGDSFFGRVHSSKPACRRGRRIVVFRVRSGADERIRGTRSRRGGRWVAIPPGRRAGGGRYYAVMRAKSLGGGSCAAVTTGELRVQR